MIKLYPYFSSETFERIVGDGPLPPSSTQAELDRLVTTMWDVAGADRANLSFAQARTESGEVWTDVQLAITGRGVVGDERYFICGSLMVSVNAFEQALADTFAWMETR